MRIKSDTTALLISDFQIDFCSAEGIAAKLGRDISPILETLPRLKKFYRLIKREGILVIFTQFIARKDISPQNMKINKNRAERFRLCLLNSRGAKFYYLQPDEDMVIQKKYYDSFAETELKQFLKKRKIDTLLISGVRTELGIDATAKRAVAEGLNVIILEDLTATYKENSAAHNQFLKVFDRYYGDVLTSEKIVELLE